MNCSAVSKISTQAALSRYPVMKESNASSFKNLWIRIYCCFGHLEGANIKTASAWKCKRPQGTESGVCMWWHVQLIRSKGHVRVNWSRHTSFKITSGFGQRVWKEIVRAGGYGLNSSAEQWGQHSHVHPLIYLSLILINFQSETDCTGDSCGQASCVGCLRKELSRQRLSPIINLQGKGCFSVMSIGTGEGDWFLTESAVLSRNNWSQENPS